MHVPVGFMFKAVEAGTSISMYLGMFWYVHIPRYVQSEVVFISTSGEPSKNRIDLRALTLAGPTRNQPVLSPLAVYHLDI